MWEPNDILRWRVCMNSKSMEHVIFIGNNNLAGLKDAHWFYCLLFQMGNTGALLNCLSASAHWTKEEDVFYAGKSLATLEITIMYTFLDGILVINVQLFTQEVILFCYMFARNIRRLYSRKILFLCIYSSLHYLN